MTWERPVPGFFAILLLVILGTPAVQATCTQPSSDDPSDWEAYEDCLAEEEENEKEDERWTAQDQNAADLAAAMGDVGLPQAVECFEECADMVVDSYDECVRTVEVCLANKINRMAAGGGKFVSVTVCAVWGAVCALWETVNVIEEQCGEVCE